MKIERIELYHFALPLAKPAQTPAGTADTWETVLVRMLSDGAEGWGEASPGNLPTGESGEWTAGSFSVLADFLAPRLIGQTVGAGEELVERIGGIAGQHAAKAAIDIAWWDLYSRMKGKPLHAMLDAKFAPAVALGVSIDEMESTDVFMSAIERTLEMGAAHVKLKMRPGWGVEMVSAVRGVFPAARLWIDVEAGLEIAQIDILHRLEDFQLSAIEQPFGADDFVGHAMLTHHLGTPISLDESMTTPARAAIVIDLDSCRLVNLKPSRVGGLTPALAMSKQLYAEEIHSYVGTARCSGIGSRAMVSLALVLNAMCAYQSEMWRPPADAADDACPPANVVRREDGMLLAEAWNEPGLGIEPDIESLRKYLVREQVIDTKL